MLELDEMKQLWAEQDRKLDANLRLTRLLVTTTSANRARSSLQRLSIGLCVEAAAWLLIAVFLGNFIYAHFTMPRAVIPAVVLDLYAIGMLVALLRLIVGIGQIDYGQPTTTVQRRVTRLRMLRIRITVRAVLAGTLAWAAIPFLLVGTSGAKQIPDSFRLWLWGNVAFGIMVIAFAWWLSRKFGQRLENHRLVHRLMNSISGRSLNQAEAFLAQLSRFEEPEPTPGTGEQIPA
jgi:hypothetical protein